MQKTRKVKSSSKASSFKYKVRDPEVLKRRAEQRGGSYDVPYKQQFTPTWKAKVGDNTVRILPPTWDSEKYGDHFGLELFLHRGIGPGFGSDYLCPLKMKSKPCPICDAAKKARAAGETTEEVNKLEAKKVVLVWMLDREKGDDNPVLWPMPWTFDRDLADVCKNRKTGGVYWIDNHEEGFDVMFRRIGEGIGTKYTTIQLDHEASPICEDDAEQNRVLDFISENSLPSVLLYRDAKYLEAVLFGQVEAKDEDLEEEEPEEEEEEEEEEEKAPPRRKKLTRRTRDEEEEEEDDEDQEASDDDDSEEEEDEPEAEAGEEDEEEDLPRRRLAASAKAKKRPDQSTRRRR